MKKFNMIMAAVAIAAFGTSASAQYWGESEVTNYVYAGYTSMRADGITLPGVHLGIGDLNQINMGNFFWDYNVDVTYNWKSENGIKTKFWSGKIALDMLYKIDASENAFVFPFLGIASRDYLYGKTKNNPLYGDVNWFSKDGLDGNRYQVCLQAGVHAFIGNIMLRAEYQYSLTKLVGARIKGLSFSIGYRF